MFDEIVNGPVYIFTAPMGTTTTGVNTAKFDVTPDLMPLPTPSPISPWEEFGHQLAADYGEDGVTVTPDQTIEEQMSLGSTAAIKAYRPSESLTVTVPMMDLRADTIAKAMNGATVAEVAAASGTRGYKEFPMLRGSVVEELALLVIGKSPFNPALNAIQWIPRAYVSSVGEFSYVKNTGALYEVEFKALLHTQHGFGNFFMQHQEAL